MKVSSIIEDRDMAYLLRDSMLEVCRHYRSAVQVEKSPKMHTKKFKVCGVKMEGFFLLHTLCSLFLLLSFSLIYSGALVVWFSS